MALIRCLGKINLPLAYRRFMRAERDAYQRKRRNGNLYENSWEQDALEPESARNEPDKYWENPFVKRHYLAADVPALEIPVPAKCPLLEARLSQIFVGKQTHVIMTVVSTPEHADDFDDQIETALVIPYATSSQHRLRVEFEERVLVPNHIYTFNQRRDHALVYDTDTNQETLKSRPASLLSVGFSNTERQE